MGFNCLKTTESLQEGSLLFTTKSPEGRKAESTLELSSGFEHGTPGLGIQLLNQEPYLAIPSSNEGYQTRHDNNILFKLHRTRARLQFSWRQL